MVESRYRDERHADANRRQRGLVLGRLVQDARGDDVLLERLRELAVTDAEVRDRLRREGLLEVEAGDT